MKLLREKKGETRGVDMDGVKHGEGTEQMAELIDQQWMKYLKMS